MKEGSICNKCNHRAYCAMSDEANNDNATIKGCYLYSEQKAKTNADCIRSMTDEELADEILSWFNWLNAVEWDNNRILEWLKQEAQNE